MKTRQSNQLLDLLSPVETLIWEVARQLPQHGAVTYVDAVKATIRAISEDSAIMDHPPTTAADLARLTDAAYDKLFAATWKTRQA